MKTDLLQLPDRWILVSTDVNGHKLDKSSLVEKTVKLLTPDENVCCLLKPPSDTCFCEDNFNIEKSFLHLLFNNFITTLDQIVKTNEESHSSDGVKSAKTNREKFEESFNVTLPKEFINWQDTSLTMKFPASIQITNNEISSIVAKLVNNEMIIPDNETVKPVRAFYRVGITHVSIFQECFRVIQIYFKNLIRP